MKSPISKLLLSSIARKHPLYLFSGDNKVDHDHEAAQKGDH
jgi:hypothetical protein